MVRNTRTLMLCSLLALATGMALGSRIVATVPESPASIRLPDASTWRSVDAGAGASSPVTDVEADAPRAADVPSSDGAEPAGLEGSRQPRMPRMSRETTARLPR